MNHQNKTNGSSVVKNVIFIATMNTANKKKMAWRMFRWCNTEATLN